MSTPTLPTELLIKIFSIVSSPSDLYHSLQASKQFADIVRPFLYFHVVIETREQRERLTNVRDEDKGFVVKVTIKGDGPIPVNDIKAHSQECRLGENVLEDLFSGKILDIRVISFLHVTHLHTSPWVVLEEVEAEIAHELLELSISSHQGGRPFWELLLQPPTLFPRLTYLRIESVSNYQYIDDVGRRVSAPSNAEFKASSDDKCSVVERVEPFIQPEQEHIDVYASEDSVTIHLDEGAESIVLAFCDLSRGPWWFKLGVEKHKNVRIISDDVNTSFTSEFYDYIFRGDVRPPYFLSIPAPRSSLSVELQSVLLAIGKFGTDVHCDGEGEDDSGSIAFIPNYFFDYIERANVRSKKSKEGKK